jgi:hypothetical protein
MNFLNLIVIIISFVQLTIQSELKATQKCKHDYQQMKRLIASEYYEYSDSSSHYFTVHSHLNKKYKINNKTVHMPWSFIVNSKKTEGATECKWESQTNWNPNRKTNCPYHYQEINRRDRFPFSVTYAECNCKNAHSNCLGLGESDWHCTLNYAIHPFIQIDLDHKNCNNDFYAFNPTIEYEYVPIGCGCFEFRNYEHY